MFVHTLHGVFNGWQFITHLPGAEGWEPIGIHQYLRSLCPGVTGEESFVGRARCKFRVVRDACWCKRRRDILFCGGFQCKPHTALSTLGTSVQAYFWVHILGSHLRWGSFLVSLRKNLTWISNMSTNGVRHLSISLPVEAHRSSTFFRTPWCIEKQSRDPLVHVIQNGGTLTSDYTVLIYIRW